MAIRYKRSANVLAKSLAKVWPEIISNIEERMAKVADALGEKEFDKAFIKSGSKQETNNCTSLFQQLVTVSIIHVCKNRNIKLVSKDEKGYDWLFGKMEIEQKCRTILRNGSSEVIKNMFKNDNGVGLCYRYGFTGAAVAAWSGTKTDIHLLMAFEIDGSKIKRTYASILSLKETGSFWKVYGKKGKLNRTTGYATLIIAEHSFGSAIINGEHVELSANMSKGFTKKVNNEEECKIQRYNIMLT